MKPYKRIFTIVIDSLGVGAMPNAAEYDDVGCDTLGHIDAHMLDFNIPNLAKLGLANLASIVSLYLLGAGAAAAIALVRIVLVGFTFGNLSMMLYSLAGAAVSLLLMVLFRRLDWFGVTGVSILGGAGHNIGQLIVAALVVENASLFYYLPVLLAAGTVAGALIGLLGGILVNRLKCLDLTKFM